jgi:peptidoglycan/xylan/chitin deacetylase (PgdA/CDA1 family)
MLQAGLLEKTAIALALPAFAAGVVAYAAYSAESQILGPVLVAPPHPREFALTFDDGPSPLATPRLLEVLARHGVRATFFLIGENVRRAPALTRELVAAGHRVGNHTLTHPWLTWLPESRIRAELEGCNRALEDTLGAPVTLFRPPHGARRPAVIRIARELGLTTVNWNIITGDWMPIPAATILGRIERGSARNRRRGRATNVVLHDGGWDQPRLPTVEATDRLLSRLGNTSFVTPDAWLPTA